MNKENTKEELSLCYISTISTNAGMDYEILRHDDDSTDALEQGGINYRFMIACTGQVLRENNPHPICE
ncbi:MAG: hypothetical protein J6H31_06270 [Butyrivibrio sp.]|nr:hypothetical protein [Butyrivibrio sp.]